MQSCVSMDGSPELSLGRHFVLVRRAVTGDPKSVAQGSGAALGGQEGRWREDKAVVGTGGARVGL